MVDTGSVLTLQRVATCHSEDLRELLETMPKLIELDLTDSTGLLID